MLTRAILIAAFLLVSSCSSVQRSPSCVSDASAGSEGEDAACRKGFDPTRFIMKPHFRGDP